MNRLEFSSLLVRQREAHKIGKNELCRITGFTFLQLQRIENADNNYNLGLVFCYLSALKSCMILKKDNEESYLAKYNQTTKWLVSARKEFFSQRALAEAIGMSYVMLARIETQKSNLTIDVFLKIAEILGYSIEIRPIVTNLTIKQ